MLICFNQLDTLSGSVVECCTYPTILIINEIYHLSVYMKFESSVLTKSIYYIKVH